MKSRQKRPIKTIIAGYVAGFVIEGQIMYGKEMPCKTVYAFHRASM